MHLITTDNSLHDSTHSEVMTESCCEGLLSCIYTEQGTDSHYDITITKLSKFYDTVDFLPVLFLGFYTSAELARLILLLKTMSSLRTNLIDQGVHLAQVLSHWRCV